MRGVRRLRRRVRRGSAYVVVLTVAMLVALIGLTTIAFETSEMRRSRRERETESAAALAMSAVELGLAKVKTSSGAPNWRDAVRAAGEDVGPVLALDGGTLQWTLENSSGSRMSSDDAKPIYVVGTGTHGVATHKTRAIVRPSGPAYTALTVPLYATDGFAFGSGSLIQGSTKIVSGDNVTATSASVFPIVEAVSTITGGTYHAATVVGVSELGVPGPGVFDYYLTQGTRIDATALPQQNGDLVLRDLVLSPTVNPFGTPNAEGIYVIDTDEQPLRLEYVRILGTLVVEGLAGDQVIVQNAVHMAPAVTSFPTLLVDGALELGLTATELSEVARGTNFNPPGTPFEGESDADQIDTFPSEIRSIVFAEDRITVVPDYTRIEGTLITRDDLITESGAIIELVHDPSVIDNPPPGFYVPDGGVRVAAFSWRRVVD
ncbi:MAG: hypothetical protein HKO59_10585 [Phycisphaerales bacterium]|nr:hypothetical protein [Phycisphaerae bacterium]NNF43752.1 hypothetical protein [Phycisphaerales bacterium]NNM26409.1 hypothetical protein [Phycisphaerales bacterium]